MYDPKPYGLNELREMFLKFFESKEHLRLPSFSLIPQNDASLLLINSGMAPMKPFFTGEQEPPRHRVTTCQKCIRTGDIENIGHTARHGTYFEMLGNFSFGDYFKKEAIHWAWEFLTSPEWVGLDPSRLYPSVFAGNETTPADDEAFRIWNEEIGIPAGRIFKFGKEDNFWEHGSGPCGPCSEIYYDRGEKYGCGKPGCTVGCDCDRYIEVWNVVFSQFDNDGDNHYTELKQKNIDTGMGLERLACVCQGVGSLFDVDTVMNITNKVSEITHAHYGESREKDVSLRVITDHIRSSVFMICDGVLPSNEGRGYVLRRLLRRAARHGKLLGVNEPFLYQVCGTVIHENGGHYPELRERQDYITKVIRVEEENFAKTIDGGLKIFNEMLAGHKEKGEKTFSGADAFKLGQVADHGMIFADKAGFEVTDVQKNKGGKYMHYGRMTEGVLKVGDTVGAQIDKERRMAVMRAHTATHLLDKALREVLGDHVHQAGSLVEPDRLRFDFTHFEAMTPEQVAQVSRTVNDAILSGYAVDTQVLPIEEAKERGAIALFGEKYGDTVRVVDMGDGYSVEFCGGTHLPNTAMAGAFRIKSEFSVASGVRRIEATTGRETLAFYGEVQERINQAAAVLKAKPGELREKAEAVMGEIKNLHQMVEKFKAKEAAGETDRILFGAHEVGSLKVLTATVPEADGARLRQMGDMLREKDANVVAVLASVNDGKITFLCACGKEAVKQGIKAGDIIKQVCAIAGGSGGGKPDSAMGGGKDVLMLDNALAMVDNVVAMKLGL